MKPLGKGAKRTELRTNLTTLLVLTDVFPGMYDPNSITPTAAVLGGALQETLDDFISQHFEWPPVERKANLEVFWRLFNDNTWRLTRSLKASGLLKEIK